MSDRPDPVKLARNDALDVLAVLRDAADLYDQQHLFSALADCEEAIATLTVSLWPDEGRL